MKILYQKICLLTYLFCVSLSTWGIQLVVNEKATSSFDPIDLDFDEPSQFSGYSARYTTMLFGKPVTISFIPLTKGVLESAAVGATAEGSGDESDSNDIYIGDPEAVTVAKLVGFMVTYDFGSGQVFHLNLSQNFEVTAEQHQSQDIGEFYGLTEPFRQKMVAIRGDKAKATVTDEARDADIYDPFAPYILASLERLVEYDFNSYPPSDPRAWSSSPVNANNQVAYQILGHQPERRGVSVNLAYFFPAASEVDPSDGARDPHDLCTMSPQQEILTDSCGNDIVRLLHRKNAYVERKQGSKSLRTKLTYGGEGEDIDEEYRGVLVKLELSGARLTSRGEALIKRRISELREALRVKKVPSSQNKSRVALGISPGSISEQQQFKRPPPFEINDRGEVRVRVGDRRSGPPYSVTIIPLSMPSVPKT